MPKQTYKITEFHGGLNSNSDARDIAENELSEATDVMVDELGKIRLMGGTAAGVTANVAAIEPGYGLFQFSHDRLEAATGDGAAAAETGDDYLAMADVATSQIDIYSRVANAWGTGKIDLGTETSGMKAAFYASDGAMRVSDGNFGDNNESKWYGYIDRYFLGDGDTLGHDGTGSDAYANGLRVNKWHVDDIAPKALGLKDWGFLEDRHNFEDSLVLPTIADPISVIVYNVPYNYVGQSGSASLTAETHSAHLYAEWRAASPHITLLSTGHVTAGLATMFSVGDKIFIHDANDAGNNGVKTVTAVSSANPNTMDISGTVLAESTDSFYITNLSRQSWFDPDNQSWELAVSTLYDDSKQESPLSIHGSAFGPADWLYLVSQAEGPASMHKVTFEVYLFAGDGTNDGIPIASPRVSGFNIYMRREGTSEWYQQANVDITKGIRLTSDSTYSVWQTYGGDTAADEIAAGGNTRYIHAPQTVVTYEDSAGIDGSATSGPFEGTGTGFKTAVIANRRAYVANFKAKDSSGNKQVYGDAIMKSQVNKFDSFSLDNRLEAEIRDGDSIVKLEEYADRLLQFKKNKMTLINISQEIEFIEDTFMHKGISHSAASCKTDFGIAWVNSEGCYLYDGQKVDNLLEKQGRQIIKESLWATFCTNEPMIGYIPKKRQLLIANDVSTTGDGSTFLYDMVTRSWVKGAAATITSEDKTNFVTDWNGDLIYAHTDGQGTVVKWSDAAEASAAVDIKTRDIDFGQPSQTKRIYKFYVTHRGSASNIQLSYAINGDQDSYTSVGSELPATSPVTDWVTTAITATTFSCTSVRLRLFSQSTTTPANFEINDITIVFRPLGQR